jgi:CIC family chloride channel protein
MCGRIMTPEEVGWNLSMNSPAIQYRKGRRGYHLHFGSLRLPQSSYLLAAAIVVGTLGGYGAIGFRWLIGAEQHVAFGILESAFSRVVPAFALVLVLAVGGAIAASITARFAPEARGHGVPEVMAAVALRGGVIRPRVIGIKAIASATSIAFGGSVGREGPIVQIGAAIGSVLGQIVHAPVPVVRTLVACGAAAGISATFNAPIGGVFFASEVILGDFAPRSFSTIVVSSVLAAVVSRAYLGNRPSFDARAFVLISPRELVLYAVLGVICAVWAWAFVRVLYWFEDAGDRWKVAPEIKGACGFALVGVIGLYAPQVLGVGYEGIQHVFDSHVGAQQALALSLLKPLATSLTLGAGGSGGVFAPSLFTGAMLGDAFGRIANFLFPIWTAPAAAYGLVAMAALFSAAAEAPITAIVIVFEMSGDYTIILPLMIATVISTVLGRRFLNSTVYELKLERRGIDWKRVRRPHALASTPVSTVARAPFIVARVDEKVGEVATRLRGQHELIVPVTDDLGAFVGIVTGADLAWQVASAPDATIGQLVQTITTTLAPDESLERAADLMADSAVGLLPVVSPDAHLLGIVTRSDILNAYRSIAAR